MKQDEIMKNVLNGVPVVVVEYRSFKIETIRYTDKKTGSAVSKPMIKHGIEMGDQQATITEWLPDGAVLTDVKPHFKKGDKCILKIQGVEQIQGFASIRGTLEPYEPAK